MMSSMGASSSATVSCSLRASGFPALLSGPWMNACRPMGIETILRLEVRLLQCLRLPEKRPLVAPALWRLLPRVQVQEEGTVPYLLFPSQRPTRNM